LKPATAVPDNRQEGRQTEKKNIPNQNQASREKAREEARIDAVSAVKNTQKKQTQVEGVWKGSTCKEGKNGRIKQVLQWWGSRKLSFKTQDGRTGKHEGELRKIEGQGPRKRLAHLRKKNWGGPRKKVVSFKMETAITPYEGTGDTLKSMERGRCAFNKTVLKAGCRRKKSENQLLQLDPWFKRAMARKKTASLEQEKKERRGTGNTQGEDNPSRS